MLTSFFDSRSTLSVPQSLLLKRLKSIASQNNLLLYEKTTIFHQEQKYSLPLLILDKSRGIYLFEYKEWSYDELKHSSIQKATQSTQATNTLAYEKLHEVIKEKLNQFSKTKELPIYNFLLMENFNDDQYEHLDQSFKELLPKEKILFSDSNSLNIIKKLQIVSPKKENLTDIPSLVNNIIFQHSILDNDLNPQLATPQQVDFIHSKLSGHCALNGLLGSGKSSTILIKAIFESIQNKYLKIAIIKSTKLSCDILNAKLNTLIANQSFVLKENAITILTPIEFVNKHLQRIGNEELDDELIIDTKLMKKKFHLYNIIFCDDADFLPIDFISYLLNIQKDSPLLFVTNSPFDITYKFDKSFRINHQNKLFYKTDPHEKTLEIVEELLITNDPKDILIVSDPISRSMLYEDIMYQFDTEVTMLDSSKTKKEQNIDTLMLSTYVDFYGINAEHIIMLDICSAPYKELAYLFFLCDNTTHLLYEDECDLIISLKENYENNKNR